MKPYIDIIPLLSGNAEEQDKWLEEAISTAKEGPYEPLVELSQSELLALSRVPSGFINGTFARAKNNGPFAGVSFLSVLTSANAYFKCEIESTPFLDEPNRYELLTDDMKSLLPADILMILALKGDLGDRRYELKEIVIKCLMKEKGYSVDG